MHSDFIQFASTLLNESLLELDTLFLESRSEWLSAITEHFEMICQEIVKLQKEATLSAISYIDYTMLYTNFINRHYKAEVWVYGDDWYCDINQRMIAEYDLSFLFTHFDSLWDALLTARKRYVGQVTAKEITAFMLKAASEFYSYLTTIIRVAIADSIESQPFLDIAKNEVFRISVGDYMAKTEPVFSVDKNQDAEALQKWLAEDLGTESTFRDYSGLDLSEQVLKQKNFNYAQFRHANLSGVSFEGSSLIGANFYKASMEKCILDYCSIFEADFSHAILKGARFVLSRRPLRAVGNKKWRHPSLLPANFRYADLTNADFRWAHLEGADFTGAILTNTDFTGAMTSGAIFNDNII